MTNRTMFETLAKEKFPNLSLKTQAKLNNRCARARSNIEEKVFPEMITGKGHHPSRDVTKHNPNHER